MMQYSATVDVPNVDGGLRIGSDVFEAAKARVLAAGGLVEEELYSKGYRPVAFCADPFGNGFCRLGGAPGHSE